MSIINNEDLRRLALAASPGPWYPCGARYTMISRDLNAQEVEDVVEVCNHFADEKQIEANKQFIAAANPVNVIELLDQIRELKLNVIQEKAKQQTADIVTHPNGEEIGKGLIELGFNKAITALGESPAAYWLKNNKEEILK